MDALFNVTAAWLDATSDLDRSNRERAREGNVRRAGGPPADRFALNVFFD